MPTTFSSRRSLSAVSLLLLTLVAGGACGEDEGPTGPEEGTVVVFAFEGWPEDTLRVLVRNEATVAAARAYIAGTSDAHIPIGPIVRGAGIDSRYPFHFLPEEVELAEVTIELCDGAPMRTEQAVDEFFEGSTGEPDAQRATWCPWGAYPVEVEV